MSLRLHQSDDFWADLTKRVDWYRDHGSPQIAERFVLAVQETVKALVKMPGVGRPRFADWLNLLVCALGEWIIRLSVI